MDELDTAITLAIKYHSGQTDKMGLPYIFHPMNVMMRMHDDDSNTLKLKRIVAILHDVVEDCGISTLDLMEELDKFSPINGMLTPDYLNVWHAIALLTHDKDVPYADYIAEIMHNDIARCVKIADMEHNMSPERMDALPIETQDYLKNKYTEPYARLTAPME